MKVIRKVVAVFSALGSILMIFLALRAIGLALSNYHASTLVDRFAPWLLVAALFLVSYVLMNIAERNLR